MMTGMNVPTRIGHAVCLPGDVVVGTISGVIFIPAHLAEYVASTAEKAHLRDIFGFERLQTKTYTASQIDALVWTREMMEDFMAWIETSPQADNYRHLDWGEELALANQAEEQNQAFNGLVTYKYS